MTNGILVLVFMALFIVFLTLYLQEADRGRVYHELGQNLTRNGGKLEVLNSEELQEWQQNVNALPKRQVRAAVPYRTVPFSRVSHTNTPPVVSYLLWHNPDDPSYVNVISALRRSYNDAFEILTTDRKEDVLELVDVAHGQMVVIVEPHMQLVNPSFVTELVQAQVRNLDALFTRSFEGQKGALAPPQWRRWPDESEDLHWSNVAFDRQFLLRNHSGGQAINQGDLRELLRACDPARLVWLNETMWQSGTVRHDWPQARVNVELKGGLGNQMFQVAAAYGYAKDHGMVLSLDRSEIKSSENTPGQPNYFVRTFWFVEDDKRNVAGVWNQYQEPTFEYRPIPKHIGHVRLSGYFQSARYFDAYRAELAELYTSKRNVAYQLPPNPVSLHVRRGDYTWDPKHVVQSMDYYRRAMARIEAVCDQTPTYVVFSDDQGWCRGNFIDSAKRKFHFVNRPDMNDEDEMVLMSRCEHHIIANSSFSWWGAYLDTKSTAKTVAPSRWFGEDILNWHTIYCPDWWIVES